MAHSYKETMNLPQTDFAMKANLAQSEPKRLEKWQREHLYERILEKNKAGKPFILHDGPPYANGPIHIGHAFNKILKDFVLKSHAQRGFFTPYVPGWDCHGQPIEHMVEKTLGPQKMQKIDQPTLRRLCREWAERFIAIQREGFQRLGVNADWDHPYLTFTPHYESGNVEVFKKMYLDGSIYRGRKPIHWCKRCRTALAEAEIEYSDEVSPSIFVKFKLDSIPGVFKAAGATGEAFVLIWTTTPWTLPANTAVSLAPDADYAMVCVDGSYLLFAHKLVHEVATLAGWTNYQIVCGHDGQPITLKGRELTGLTYTCPIRRDLKGKIIYGDHVTLDTGTGAVHTAPGHGQEDYLVAQEFDVAVLMPVDDAGVLTDEAAAFAGMGIDEATPAIISWLDDNNTLVAERKITHSYPHCWRCHEPVIFRATDQWFVSMDKNALREKALNAIEEEVNWIPTWASRRIGSMVADRPDWCISRQRSWGVPLPVFKCAKCASTVATEETFDAVIDLFDREGADAWFTRAPSEYLPRTTKCSVCSCSELLPEKDILDVWWESGVSHTAVLLHRRLEGLNFPADMYLEGSDQHRGWFQSSLLTSVGAYGVAPYKSVMHCGFTVDGEGRKMSKSLGNGVDPADVMAKSGADVLRLWVSSVDYSQDVSISEEILQRTSEAYRRIRNTFRFLLGSVNDFDMAYATTLTLADLEPLDRWMMGKTHILLHDIEAAYDAYKYHQVYRLVYDFIVSDLSAIYMDATKDRLYSEARDSSRRRAVQAVLMNVLEVLVRVLSPILSFTTDEVWDHYPPAFRNQSGRPTNVQLAGWPSDLDFLPSLTSQEAQEGVRAFDAAISLREYVMKCLETQREQKNLTKSQEARVVITACPTLIEQLKTYPCGTLEEVCIVSGVLLKEGSEEQEPSVEIQPAPGEKCPRCWNYRQLGGNPHHLDVCDRCASVLDSLGYKEDV